jgi:hypothetical protein
MDQKCEIADIWSYSQKIYVSSNLYLIKRKKKKIVTMASCSSSVDFFYQLEFSNKT